MNIGDRVHTAATNFDSKDNQWSIAVFGENYKNALCFGTVKKINDKNIATVLWDIDNEEMAIPMKFLIKTPGVYVQL